MAILDHNVPQPENVPYSQIAFKTGAAIALFGVIYGLVTYLAGLNEVMMKNTALSLLNMVFYVGVAFWFCYSALKKHRKDDLGGYLSVGRGVAFGVLAGVVAGVLSAIWTYVFMEYIAPDMMASAEEAMMENFEKQGMDEEQIEQAMKISMAFMTPTAMSISIFIMTIIYGLIGGLIAGLVLKREPHR